MELNNKGSTNSHSLLNFFPLMVEQSHPFRPAVYLSLQLQVFLNEQPWTSLLKGRAGNRMDLYIPVSYPTLGYSVSSVVVHVLTKLAAVPTERKYLSLMVNVFHLTISWAMNLYNQNSQLTLLCRVFLEQLVVLQSINNSFWLRKWKVYPIHRKISPFDHINLEQLSQYVHKP